MVAQLSEHAAAGIGANPLLARVCALYHDIGKTAHPEFFGENQRTGVNPHDRLPPARSAEIIKAHVDDGVALALKHKLPRAVVDVIRQHHGTTLVRYFYQRAVEQTRSPLPAGAVVRSVGATLGFAREHTANPLVDHTDYRYDGPRPRFKESAVIHLADGVEAASRSLRDVSPERLAELIARIVRDRTDEQQLDEATLTFEELSRIKESFARTLLNMTHTRVEYPTAEAAGGEAEGLKAEG
jgi:putative nucleotidyltransferase with HDIG domain